MGKSLKQLTETVLKAKDGLENGETFVFLKNYGNWNAIHISSTDTIIFNEDAVKTIEAITLLDKKAIFFTSPLPEGTIIDKKTAKIFAHSIKICRKLGTNRIDGVIKIADTVSVNVSQIQNEAIPFGTKILISEWRKALDRLSQTNGEDEIKNLYHTLTIYMMLRNDEFAGNMFLYSIEKAQGDVEAALKGIDIPEEVVRNNPMLTMELNWAIKSYEEKYN